jgi:hypothetical protein
MLVMLTLAGILVAQAPDSWNVGWRHALDSNGRPSRMPVFIWAGAEAPVTGKTYGIRPELGIVVQREEDFRRARATADAAALRRILDDAYRETTADGTVRDKKTAIASYVDAKPDDVSLERSSVRLDGAAVVITAIERTMVGSSMERTMATRVYNRDRQGNWRLTTSTSRPAPER